MVLFLASDFPLGNIHSHVPVHRVRQRTVQTAGVSTEKNGIDRSCTNQAAIIICIFLFAFLIPGQAQSAEPAVLDAAFELVEAAVANGEVPGAVALVSQGGKIVREQAYGLADVEQNIPFTSRTICWVASITKPVTVAAAMKLVEDGWLGA